MRHNTVILSTRNPMVEDPVEPRLGLDLSALD